MHIPLKYRSGCNHEMGCGKYLGCIQAFWNLECFCCHSCGYPIIEHEVHYSLLGFQYSFHLSNIDLLQEALNSRSPTSFFC
uniref:Uncharacterized protein n=1 Tax=Nelumbo nucifera TaxID=4432 RepID=A0A822XUV6_NELNU|nr:TPA_asm: hypothetical protein HUJ06_024048 [Nelumbo nucifera]